MACDIIVQVIFFGLQLRVVIVERGDLGLDLRDQALPPIDGALHIFDLAFDVAAFGFGVPDRRLQPIGFAPLAPPAAA